MSQLSNNLEAFGTIFLGGICDSCLAAILGHVWFDGILMEKRTGIQNEGKLPRPAVGMQDCTHQILLESSRFLYFS